MREGAFGGDVVTHDTIPQRLIERALSRGDDPAYFVKEHGAWQATSWASYGAEVNRVAKALIALGLEPGQNVALIGGNRPEWSVFMLAAMTVGARGAGVYTTSSPSEIRHVLAHAEARLVLIESEAQFERFRGALDELPRLTRVITMQHTPPIDHPLVLGYRAFRALGKSIPDAEVHKRVKALSPDDVATLVYTSGAEGPPQGVMLSHRNLTWTSDVVRDVLRIGPGDSSLSYLPLSHVSEQMFTVHGPTTTGSAVYYAESVRAAPNNLREVQPSIVFGVPRIWDKLRDGMTAKLARVHGPRAQVVLWARQIGTRLVQASSEGREPSLELGLQYELAHKLALAKIKRALGLSNARVCLSGAAPIDEDTLAFFASLGVQILEVYGQSESAGPITINQPRRTRIGSVGPKLPGSHIEIADDGEVLVTGPNVFLGYLHDPEATARALYGGKLHTGDLGQLDRDGFLIITGRKREILVTAGGKNIAPRALEASIRREPLVRDALVLGDRRRFLAALITVDPEVAHELGLSGELCENEIVRQRIADRIEALNGELASVEHIKRWVILPRVFGVHTGELTPTLKMRRQRIAELWAGAVEQLYAEPLVAPVQTRSVRP
jgi:long-chain acyl-CoA synthetase